MAVIETKYAIKWPVPDFDFFGLYKLFHNYTLVGVFGTTKTSFFETGFIVKSKDGNYYSFINSEIISLEKFFKWYYLVKQKKDKDYVIDTIARALCMKRHAKLMAYVV